MNGSSQAGNTVIELADRLYAVSLFVMPRDFRTQYASEARGVFRDLCRDAFSRGGHHALLRLFRRTVLRTIGGAFAERLSRLRGRDRYRNHPPTNYHRPNKDRRMFAWQDVIYAIRSYRNHPGFALTAITTIALGIGATTTIFSVVDAVLLRGLPYPDAERLIYFDAGSHTGPDYTDWVERLTAFDQIASVWPSSESLTNEGDPLQVTVARATPNLFPMLGARPAIGRLPVAGDAEAGATPTAVISHAFWMNRWGGDSTVLDRTLRLDDTPYKIVGVMSAELIPPLRVLRQAPQIWTSLHLTREELQTRGMHVLGVLGHLAPGATLAHATEQMNAWETWAQQNFPEHNISPSGEGRDVPLRSLHDATVSNARTSLYMLFGAVCMMLLIACVNVANLFLANGSTRVREMAVRSALGANRSRILLQSLTESLVLSVAGGSVGMLLSYFGVGAVTTIAPANTPRLHEVAVDFRVLVFAILAAVTTGILFGLAPAIYSARVDVHTALKDSGQRLTAGLGSVRLKSGLVILELALAIVLLVGAGLMFNSFVGLNRVDPGFESQNLLTMTLQLGPSYDQTPGQRLQFARDAFDRLSGVPGVEVASVGVTIPFAMGGRCCYMSNAHYTRGDATDSTRIVIHPIGPRYLETMGARLLRGREFGWNERTDGESVTVIPKTLADRFFGDGDPIDRVISVGRSQAPYRVVGVYDDIMYWSLSQDDDIDIFVPYDKVAADMPLFAAVARTTVDTDALIPEIRGAIGLVDPNLPTGDITTMNVRIRETISDTRFLSVLLISFSVIASLLAAIGVYSTMLYIVSLRNHEFGVRIALGADTRQLLGHIMKYGTKVTVVGLLFGTAGAFASTRILSSMLFGVTPTDVPTFVAVLAGLATIALFACYLPARRATRADPISSLRTE